LRPCVHFNPGMCFSPHWSWKVPKAVLDEFECVCFHMTDVPYGRGGSPLQNLILAGHQETKISALRMVEEMDAGPVYLKQPMLLSGSAKAIYERASDVVFDMIGEMTARQPVPMQQEGTVAKFSRRKPSESRLPVAGEASNLYDHIRMLDAPTYPPAFIEWGDFRLEFGHAELVADGSVSAQVSIRKKKEEP
jgi:methionyl-tRNA formyltransferase